MSHKIAKVVVRGFRSHMESAFEYAPGLTVVTGATDGGKSSGVIQPIKWVAFGEPEGEEFIFTIKDPLTHEVIRQAEYAEVEITTDDLLTVRKRRRKGKTTWWLNDQVISEKADVPDEVKTALGFTKHSYGDFETTLNFAYQLEAPFLISETPSVGAKVLGKLAGTEVVDKAVTATSKKVFKAREDKSREQRTVEQKDVELLEYLQLEDKIAIVEQCEEIIRKIDIGADRAINISMLINNYNSVEGRRSHAENEVTRLATVAQADVYMQSIDSYMIDFDSLATVYVAYMGINERLTKTSDALSKYVNVAQCGTRLEEVENTYKAYIALKDLLGDYINLDTSLAAKMKATEAYKGIADISVLLDRVETESNRHDAIKNLYSEWCSITIAISKRSDAIRASENLPTCVSLLEDVEGKVKQLEALKEVHNLYIAREAAVTVATATSEKATQALECATKELESAWHETGGVCPLCDQAIH